MEDLLPELCDHFPEQVRVFEPMFGNFGGRERFSGPIQTVKTFEDNSLVREQVSQPGLGRVLVVDGGGSMRCALLGDMLAAKASENGWSGIVIFGCIRDVNALADTDIGVQALGIHPVKSEKKGRGELGVPVRIAGVDIVAGDYCYADNNGILVSSEPLILD